MISPCSTPLSEFSSLSVSTWLWSTAGFERGNTGCWRCFIPDGRNPWPVRLGKPSADPRKSGVAIDLLERHGILFRNRRWGLFPSSFKSLGRRCRPTLPGFPSHAARSMLQHTKAHGQKLAGDKNGRNRSQERSTPTMGSWTVWKQKIIDSD